MRSWLLVLAACGAGTPEPVVWLPPVEVAAGAGHKGIWHQNESHLDYIDDPTVALDGSDALVAWVDNAAKDVLVQRIDPRGLRSGPIDVSRSPAVFSWLPRLVVSELDPQNVYVLWQEIVFSGGTHGGDIFFSRSRDGGVTFETPLNLSHSQSGDGKARLDADTWLNGSLDLATDAGGTLYATWTDYEGALWFAMSTDEGASFSSPRAIVADPAHPARAPAVAAGHGVIYLAWTIGEDSHADIRIATSHDGGASFRAPAIVTRTEGYSDAPKLAVDRHGTLHLVHGEANDGPFGRSQIRYLRSQDRGRTFEDAREISAPLPNGARSAAFPMLAVDGDHVVVTWEQYPKLGRPRGLAIAVSRDAGTSFSRPRAIPGSRDPSGGVNGSQQGRLMRKLAVRGATVAVVNSALRQGVNSRVWLLRGTLR